MFDDENDQIRHTFTFANITRQPLTITKQNKSCNCTSLSVSKSQLNAGESATVEMRIDPMKSEGSYKVAASLLTNDSNTTYDFAINYKVYNRIKFDVTSLDLGSVSSAEDSTPHSPRRKRELLLETKRTVGDSSEATPILQTEYPISARIVGSPVVIHLDGNALRRTQYTVEVSIE